MNEVHRMSLESALELIKNNDSLEAIELEDILRAESFQSEECSVLYSSGEYNLSRDVKELFDL